MITRLIVIALLLMSLSKSAFTQNPLYLEISPLDTIICENDTVDISIYVSGIPPVFLVYRDEDGNASEVQMPNSNSRMLQFHIPGVYTVSMYGNSTDTVFNASQPFRIRESPNHPQFHLGGGNNYCSDDVVVPVTIEFEGTPPFYFRYLEDGVEREIQTDQHQITFPSEGSYGIQTISLSDSFGCVTTNTQFANFSLIELPPAVIHGDTLFCERDIARFRPAHTTYTPVWELSGGGNPIEEYDEQGQLLRVIWDSAGRHQLSLMYTEAGCPSELVHLYVTVNESPEVYDYDTSLCMEMDEVLEVNIHTEDGDEVLWLPYEEEITSRLLDTAGSYTYRHTNALGCSATGRIDLLNNCTPQFHVPDAFSPNGDGINDELLLFGLYSALEFSIYSADGVLIYSADEDDAPWDGTQDGKDMPVGSYYWHAVYYSHTGQGQVKSGTVTIIR